MDAESYQHYTQNRVNNHQQVTHCVTFININNEHMYFQNHVSGFWRYDWYELPYFGMCSKTVQVRQYHCMWQLWP